MDHHKRVLLLHGTSSVWSTFLRKLEKQVREVSGDSSIRLSDSFDVIAATPVAWILAAQLASGHTMTEILARDTVRNWKEQQQTTKETTLCWLAPPPHPGIQALYWWQPAHTNRFYGSAWPEHLPDGTFQADPAWILFQLMLSGEILRRPLSDAERWLWVVLSAGEGKPSTPSPGLLPSPTLQPFLIQDTSYDFLSFPENGRPADGLSSFAELLTLLRYRVAAPDDLDSSQLKPFFAKADEKASDVLHFQASQRPDLPFKKAVKKAIPIEVCEINQPFIVETMEGPLQGKAGDFLMIGVQGEMYPCDREIFFETYDFV